MGTRVKICGLANAADVAAVAALQPDYLGFILWAGSPRGVTADAVAAWTAGLPPSLRRVGVFVDATPDQVRQAVEVARLDVVQWHGRSAIEPYAKLAPQLWQVVRMAAAAADVPIPPVVVPACVDALLLDTYSPTSPGGTGLAHDWGVARQVVAQTARPVWLAGGLRPETVAAAIAVVQPWGVDVSSGVEARPGHKDLSKVRDFIHAARSIGT